MKRFIISVIAIFCAVGISAQETQVEPSGPVQMNLSSFTAIDVNAPIKLKLIKIDKAETPYIIYDTKGVYTSKFTVEVERKKGGILKIEERSDPKRESTTEVTVYFNDLTDLSISKADVTIDGTLKSNLLDLHLSNGTHFTADIDALDTKVTASGKCCIVLSGYSRYQTVDISTAEYNAAKLETLSTVASSSHNAVVKINATERLEATTSTGGKILYYTEPVILRTEITLFGGEIKLL